jgi:hypothetical protein
MNYEFAKEGEIEYRIHRIEDDVVDQVEFLIRKYGSQTIKAAVFVVNEQLEHEITGDENPIVLAYKESHLTFNRDNGYEVSQGIERAMSTLPESLR